MQTTSHILMIRPADFTYNSQTAVNNAFQIKGEGADVQEKALKEFNGLVALLLSRGMDITVVNDTPEPHTPDSLFPNNWISFHEDGTVLLYPMYAQNRRLERKPAVIKELQSRFRINTTIDLTGYEEKDRFLEGTGSMVLDRDHKIAYACISPRTDKELVQQFCMQMHYEAVVFTALDQQGGEIYHTNVMMCVANSYVVICLESIANVEERSMVRKCIQRSGKEIIEISLSQMNSFAGNMLQVSNKKGELLLVMSTQAYQSLTSQQLERLTSFNEIVHASLHTIETNGGGSARCMMAEIFLPEIS